MPGGQEKLSVCRPNGHAAFWKKGVDKVGAVWYSNKAVREDGGRKARKTDENIENFRKDLKKVLDKALAMW